MKIQLDYNEIKRYLKYDNNELDINTQLNIEKSIDLLEKIAQPKYTYQIFDIEVSEDKVEIKNKNISFNSKNLALSLKNATQAVFLVATLGLELDYQIKRLEITDLSLAYVLNAVAVEYLEKFLDYIQENKLNNNNLQKFRYSIGYGDLELSNQKKHIDLVNATKLIGVNVLKTNLMVPSKSVSAIIGISDNNVEDYLNKCLDCLPNGKCSSKCIGKDEF